MRPRRIKASGTPVVVCAPSQGIEARGEQLEYDLETGQLELDVLDDSQEVFLKQGPNEIHARWLQYQLAEEGRLGRAAAKGPGWLRAESEEKPDQQLYARWGKLLHLRPHEGQPVISLYGDAELEFGVAQVRFVGHAGDDGVQLGDRPSGFRGDLSKYPEEAGLFELLPEIGEQRLGDELQQYRVVALERGKDVGIGPLEDNEGPPLTHALLEGSPAIDAGDNDACPNNDQRGSIRPADGDEDGTFVCDIGAFELFPGYTTKVPCVYSPSNSPIWTGTTASAGTRSQSDCRYPSCDCTTIRWPPLPSVSYSTLTALPYSRAPR